MISSIYQTYSRFIFKIKAKTENIPQLKLIDCLTFTTVNKENFPKKEI